MDRYPVRRPASTRAHHLWSMVCLLSGAACVGTIEEPRLAETSEPNLAGATTGNTHVRSADAAVDADVVPGLSRPGQVESDAGTTTGDAEGGGTTSNTGEPTSGNGEPLPTTDDADGALTTCDGRLLPRANNLLLSEVALYQAVKIPLMRDGVAVGDRNAPVVQGRDAVVRAFVSPQAGFSAREVTAQLRIDNGGEITGYETRTTVSGSSRDEALNSTLNFTIDGADIGPSTRYALSLHESECEATSGTTALTRFPENGEYDLEALDTGVLKVKLVPVRYVADGRDVTAPAGTAIVERMRQEFFKMYPVAEVQMRVRETPLVWDRSVLASGRGWDVLLDTVLSLREQEADPGQYYYGLVTTSPTFREYCGGECVAGIAPVGGSGFGAGVRATAGIGVGFDDSHSRDTAVHELGHTHSSSHSPSPCTASGSISGVDGSYPYANGSIGSWGYDLVTGQLKAPGGVDQHQDIMGYCEPTWISDYTYEKWARWATQVNSARLARIATQASAERNWHSLIVHGDGSSEWGSWKPSQAPQGRSETVQALDERGTALATLDVVRMALSDSAAEFIFVPEPEANWSALRLGDTVVELP